MVMHKVFHAVLKCLFKLVIFDENRILVYFRILSKALVKET